MKRNWPGAARIWFIKGNHGFYNGAKPKNIVKCQLTSPFDNFSKFQRRFSYKYRFSKWPVIMQGHIDTGGQYMINPQHKLFIAVFSFSYLCMLLKRNIFQNTILKIRVKNVQYRFNLEQKSCGDKNIYFLQTFLLVGIYCRIINNVGNTFNSLPYYDLELFFIETKCIFEFCG